MLLTKYITWALCWSTMHKHAVSQSSHMTRQARTSLAMLDAMRTLSLTLNDSIELIDPFLLGYAQQCTTHRNRVRKFILIYWEWSESTLDEANYTCSRFWCPQIAQASSLLVLSGIIESCWWTWIAFEACLEDISTERNISVFHSVGSLLFV